MRCYRYMPFDLGVELIETNHLRLSSVSWFNDPFDCYGRTVGLMSDLSCRNLVNRDLARWRAFFYKEVAPLPSFLSAEAGDIVALIQLRMEKNNGRQSYIPAEVAKEWLIDQQFRLSCMSDVSQYDPKADILMWSHYGDSCRGLRVEFEIDESNLPLGCELKCVSYSDDRPLLDLAKTSTWDQDDSEYCRYVRRCLWSKCTAWSYEHEVRLVVDMFKANESIGCAVDKDGKCEYAYLNLPAGSIKFISFGFASDGRRARNLAYKYRHESFHFEQMLLSTEDYCPHYFPV